jgi:hypothetical protein
MTQMNIRQLYNVLEAHPDVSALRMVHVGRPVIRFDLAFEIHHSDGGGEYECHIEIHSLPRVFVLYYTGYQFDRKPVEKCGDDELVILSGDVSPQTICNAINALVQKACDYRRGDNSQSFYVGDDRTCRGLFNSEAVDR